MSQRFLLSASARTLSLAQVLGMSDPEAETLFASIRWTETKGEPSALTAVRSSPIRIGARAVRSVSAARGCKDSFSLTSGTLFAFHKLPLRTYLAEIAISANEVKGKNALALSRDLGVQYKTAFVLSHKIREAIASEMKGAHVGGEGKVVEVDGAYFGGYVKPDNHVENRVDCRLEVDQNGKGKVVVAIRERTGNFSLRFLRMSFYQPH